MSTTTSKYQKEFRRRKGSVRVNEGGKHFLNQPRTQKDGNDKQHRMTENKENFYQYNMANTVDSNQLFPEQPSALGGLVAPFSGSNRLHEGLRRR